MKKTIILFSIYSLLMASIFAFAWQQKKKAKYPDGFSFFEGIDVGEQYFKPDSLCHHYWTTWGGNRYIYNSGVIQQRNNRVLFIKLNDDKNYLQASALGLNQTIKADSFRNQRVRFSGSMATNACGLTGIYIQLNPYSEFNLHEDNLYWGYVKREPQWQYQEIVMDIPESTKTISYGIYSFGMFELLADNLKFEIVDKNTPLKNNEKLDRYSKDSIYARPINLNFENITER